jgi:hypothetical protein
LVDMQGLDRTAGGRGERVIENENGTVWGVKAYRPPRHGVAGV